MSKTIEMTIEIEVPDDLEATSDEIEEYIAFETGASCQMSGNNSVLNSDYEPEIVVGSASFRW